MKPFGSYSTALLIRALAFNQRNNGAKIHTNHSHNIHDATEMGAA